MLSTFGSYKSSLLAGEIYVLHNVIPVNCICCRLAWFSRIWSARARIPTRQPPSARWTEDTAKWAHTHRVENDGAVKRGGGGAGRLRKRTTTAEISVNKILTERLSFKLFYMKIQPLRSILLIHRWNKTNEIWRDIGKQWAGKNAKMASYTKSQWFSFWWIVSGIDPTSTQLRYEYDNNGISGMRSRTARKITNSQT